MNETLQSLVADIMGIPEAEITESLARAEEDRWDSLNHLRLVTAIEEAFSVRLTMEEIENIATLGEVDELIGRRTA